MFRIFNKSQFIVGHRGGVSQYSSVLPILFASVDSRFCEFTSKRITMTTSLVNIRFVVEERERERRGEGQRTIKRKRERERTRQIRYTGIAAATRAARGVRPFIGGCPALLSTRASSTSRHPRTSLSLSLSLFLFRSRLDAARPLTALLHLIGPRVLTRDVLRTRLTTFTRKRLGLCLDDTR